MYQEKRFEDFRVGDKVSHSKTITEADIEAFAALTGDRYPLHVNKEYAKTTRYGCCVAHGLLTASLLSTTNGALLGTPGGISLAQTLRYLKPVYPGDTITATTEVIEILPKRRLRCHTTCINQRGEMVVEGEAIEQKD